VGLLDSTCTALPRVLQVLDCVRAVVFVCGPLCVHLLYVRRRHHPPPAPASAAASAAAASSASVAHRREVAVP
jgi:hypothetical protein